MSTSQNLTFVARTILLRAGIDTPADWSIEHIEPAINNGWHVVGRRCMELHGSRTFHGPSIGLYISDAEIMEGLVQ